MRHRILWAAAGAAGLMLGATAAQATSIPYSLGGTWVCTFKTGDKATITARAGHSGVQYQYNDGQAANEWVSNTPDGGITAHGDGWAWTLRAKDGAAELTYEAKAKGETYTVPCSKK